VDPDPVGSGTFWPGGIRNKFFGSDFFYKKIYRTLANFYIKWFNSSLITYGYRTYFLRKSLKSLNSLAAVPLFTLRICQLFSWSGLTLKSRIRKWDDLKRRIRIRNKSFRIHNTVSCLFYNFAVLRSEITCLGGGPGEPCVRDGKGAHAR
jgi:hypothetical protein